MSAADNLAKARAAKAAKAAERQATRAQRRAEFADWCKADAGAFARYKLARDEYGYMHPTATIAYDTWRAIACQMPDTRDLDESDTAA